MRRTQYVGFIDEVKGPKRSRGKSRWFGTVPKLKGRGEPVVGVWRLSRLILIDNKCFAASEIEVWVVRVVSLQLQKATLQMVYLVTTCLTQGG